MLSHATVPVLGRFKPTCGLAARRANNIAKEGLEANKITLKMVRDAKALGPTNPGGIAHTYANVAREWHVLE